MSRELLTPVSVVQHQAGDSILSKIRFTDGTTVDEVRFDEQDNSICVISDGEGRAIPEPGAGRYPYTERAAKLALEHLDRTGTLPY